MTVTREKRTNTKRFEFVTHPDYEWHYGPAYGLDVLRILAGRESGLTTDQGETLHSCLSYLRGCNGEDEVEGLDHPMRPLLLQIIDGVQLFGVYDLLITHLNSTTTPRSMLFPVTDSAEATARVLQLDHPVFGKIYRALALRDDISDPQHLKYWRSLALELPRLTGNVGLLETFGVGSEPDLLTALDRLLPEAKKGPGRRKGMDLQKLLDIKGDVLLRGMSPSQAASRIHDRRSRQRLEIEFERKMKLRRLPGS